MHRLILAILIFSTSIALGQNSCYDKSLADLEKQFTKADKRGKSDEYIFANIGFEIAECYRQRNDTLSLKWYRNNIRTTFSALKGCDRSIEVRNFLFKIGVSSFYLGKYKDAENYFQKSIAASDSNESYYYLAKTLIQLGKWEEAKIEFLNFRSKSSDHADVEVLVKTCEDHINGR